jgi:G3E family GTPase
LVDDQQRHQRSIAVTILGGYLGAGKTTLLNQVLGVDHGERIAVIVNDFGSINIDAALIERSSADQIDLANGCVCCQRGDNLADALFELREQEPRFDRIIIEASGVALPASIAGWASLPGLRLDGIVVVVDPMTIAEQLIDRYIGDTVSRQLHSADLLVLSKVDICDPDVFRASVQLLQEHCPAAPHVHTGFAESAPLVEIFGIAPTQKVTPADADRDSHAHHASFVWSPTKSIDIERLATTLHSISGLIRAKGFVRHTDGTVYLVQLVGRRCEVTVHLGEANSCLVLIGPADRFDVTGADTALKVLEQA